MAERRASARSLYLGRFEWGKLTINSFIWSVQKSNSGCSLSTSFRIALNKQGSHMIWGTEPFVIQDENLTIRPYDENDCENIVAAIHDPNGFFAKFWDVDNPEKIRQMLSRLMSAHEMGKCNPFVYLIDNEVAGISRFLNIEPQYKSLEIGGTWVANKWKRSFVNTKVKLNLLRYAFSQLKAERVEFRVNSKNYTSQMAVLRLGASFEGKLRRRQIHPNGEASDGHVYSIISPEWPQIEERLKLLISRKPVFAPHLPFEIETQRLRLKIYSLCDACEFLEMVTPNRKDLQESFPQTANLKSLEETQAYFAERAHQAHSGHSFFYGVWNKQTNRQIGQLQIKNIDWKTRSADIGYFIESPSRMKGYATEMVQKAVDELALRKFNRTFVRILEDNKASKRFAEKLGFKYEGLQRLSFLTGDNQLRAVEFYSRSP